MPPFVDVAAHDDVAVVAIDHPPVNALSPGVPEAIFRAIEETDGAAGVRAIVIRGTGRMFVAGADIGVLEDVAWGDASKAPNWHDLFARIENCSVPVVMAIHGAALGGGLELAMAGHYRLATPGAQIGMPEVTIGLIPGAEGTQRLPRLCGLARALDLCVTGRPISASEAVNAGILDELAGDDLTASAIAYARRVVSSPIVRTRDRTVRLVGTEERTRLMASAEAMAARIRPRQTAPVRAIEAIGNSTTMPFDAACRREREIFLECAASDQARALIHLFFAERAAAKRGAAAGGLIAHRLLSRGTDEIQSLMNEAVARSLIDSALAAFGMATNVFAADAASQAAERSDERTIPQDEIVDRCVYALINEGATMLDEGTARWASDVDAVGVTTCGFPAWRGGPLLYADIVGLGHVFERIKQLHRDHGERWRPAQILGDLARSGGTFRERDRTHKR